MDKYGKSIFAHELGHSAKININNNASKKACSLYGASHNATVLVALIQMINCFRNNDESRQKLGKALSIAGGASAIPMIAEEIGASMRGTKMLGLKGADKARSFIGIASYISLALSPTIMYHVSERTRKFLRSLNKIKEENPQSAQNIENLKNSNIKVKV